MSVVPLSSPLSSSGKTDVDVKYANDCSSVSSLVFDYTLLNSIIESNQFEQTLELYSLMLNNSFNNETKISLNICINQFLEEYSQICLNEIKELIEIFQTKTFRSLISSYDLIISQFHLLNNKNLSEKTNVNFPNDFSFIIFIFF
jgi:hypothetical protein